MSDYSQVNDYSAKDSLASGNPEKLILGSDLDDEFGGISVAIATKFDSSDLASQAQAEAETSNAVLMTALRVANWADYNAGIVGDLQALVDPNADRVLGWDDSAGAAIGFTLTAPIAFNGTAIELAAGGTLPALVGTALTALNATNLTSGTVDVARLHSSVPLTTAPNTFTGSTAGGRTQLNINTNNATNAYAAWGVQNDAPRNFRMVRTSSGYTTAFLTNGSNSEGSVLWSEGNYPLDIGTNDTARLIISGGGNFDFKAGTVTTNNASASEVGFKGIPQNVQDGNYTLVLADAGKFIDKQAGGSGETITIPANGSVAFPIGTVIGGDNDGGGTLTIAITTDTLEDSAGNTGSRTVADNGSWTIRKIAATKWRITGSGIT